MSARKNERGPLGISVTGDNWSNLATIKDLAEDVSVKSLVDAFARREQVDRRTARQIKIEFLRFMSLSLFSGAPLFPPDMVERFWAFFREEPGIYADFCQKHFFGCVPNPLLKASTRQQAAERALRLVEQWYHGTYTPAIWGMP